MREDILKFRKVCVVLKSEKEYTNEKLCKELGISDPTLYKLINADIDELKGIRASTLGVIQDFMKRHCNDLNYAGIKPAPDNIVEQAADNLRKNLSNYHVPDQLKVIPEEIKSEPAEEIPAAILEQTMNPFTLFIEALKQIPDNVTIHISVNESKAQ
jgi:DNA-binding Xre family transcriptional regulator